MSLKICDVDKKNLRRFIAFIVLMLEIDSAFIKWSTSID